MNEQYAATIIKIMMTADGDCYHCAAQLIKQFCALFGFTDLAKRLYQEHFNLNLDDE
jgi:hypothetical protein